MEQVTEAQAEAKARWDALTPEEQLEILTRDNFKKEAPSVDATLEATRVDVANVNAEEKKAFYAQQNQVFTTYMLFINNRKNAATHPDYIVNAPKATGKGFDQVGSAWIKASKKEGGKDFIVLKINQGVKNENVELNDNHRAFQQATA